MSNFLIGSGILLVLAQLVGLAVLIRYIMNRID